MSVLRSNRGCSGWMVTAEGWSAEKVTHHGNLFLLGNGRMGCRGTLEEFGPEEKVGILLPGVYDRTGDAWREPVNAPNGLFVRVAVNGMWLNPAEVCPVSHMQQLDMARAVHRRKTVFLCGDVRATITSERFLSAADVDLMAMHYSLTVAGEAEIIVESGIDRRVWDLNGPHLEGYEAQMDGDVVVLAARTRECGHEVAVAEHGQVSLPSEAASVDGSLRRWTFRSDGGCSIELFKTVAIRTSIDPGESAPRAAAAACAARAAAAGYPALLAAHEAVWKERWESADVEIHGDPDAQHALRYSLYQLMSAAPFHSEHLSIPARALSGQVYKGAVFWDTEIFMFPFFLAAFPEVARNLVRYRLHTLPGARAKAAEYGFQGAFYPWEGQEGGYDACTLFNITDVFTNRPMRTYFRDKQIHISGDVAWSVWKYVTTTGDDGLLWDGGWEVMLECARFFYSYALRRTTDDRFVLVDVTGPDEYHERVADNAFTNHLVHFAVEALLEAALLLRGCDPYGFASLAGRLGFDEAEECRLKDFAGRLYLPQPDPETLVIEQFDGYHRLEDCPLAELKSRILNPAEYLGGGNGLATTTRILKQADTVLLTHLLGERFRMEVKRANWDFYEPRTEHGSSLSACVYALVAAETGRADFAYKYFLKTATIDLTGDSKQYVGTLYIGGTHPAANGGAWMVAAQGFGGIRYLPQGLQVSPRLPDGWESVSLRIHYRGYVLQLAISRNALRMEVDGRCGRGPANVIFDGVPQALADGLVVEVPAG